jgi:superfamily II DNA or RNA helicase
VHEDKSPSEYFAEWPLKACRALPTGKQPAPHQREALASLRKWYENLGGDNDGGILVLPTGGGKTFTAVHFLCNGPLSDGYKVLWLAHTHHLLEQAFKSFTGEALRDIREPRDSLNVRVVSGTPGHFPPRDIKESDDVLIATLQTVTNAHRHGLQSFRDFVASARGKLFVVFDEAHHAPAPSYRALLLDLRKQGAPALGLTATPTYSNEARKGWLKEVFPQGILAQARPGDLMASGVLAKPHLITANTSITPRFDEADFQKWLGTYRDVPEDIIEQLASNRERNALIAETYVQNREKYGKTLIFADRWYQCEWIVEALEKRGVKADAMYSQVDLRARSVEQRRRRTREENAKALERFRRGETEVLVNIRMLTEGTDLPDAQTVFLTRQTTSSILLTQMVGRALRGPKFGGTPHAYIVSFIDDWQHAICWAGYDALADGETDERARAAAKRPPLQLISIDLIKRLARQMDSGINVSPAPFVSLMPVGWYTVTYDTLVEGSEEIESSDRLVMVFDDERAGFEAVLAAFLNSCPAELGDEDARLDAHRGWLDELVAKYLAAAKRSATELAMEVFHLARHVAQGHGNPEFFAFAAREQHDVDVLARDYVARDLGPRAIHEALRMEYTRSDRFWRALFPRFDQLRSYYDSCQARLLAEPFEGSPVVPRANESPSFVEPSEEVKHQVKGRDGACLACGATHRLEVDHIVAGYHGGSHDTDNLQTLCRTCNGRKGRRTMRFRSHQTTLQSAPAAIEHFETPADAGNRDQWERFIRRTLNFTLQCAAVTEVAIGGRGDGYYHWTVELMRGNDPALLEPTLRGLLERVNEARERGGKPRVESLAVTAPGHAAVRCSASK